MGPSACGRVWCNVMLLGAMVACREGDSRAADASPTAAVEMGETGTNVAACGEENSPQRYCVSCASWAETHPGEVVASITIQPAEGERVTARCEFARGGGGWTLLATNAWDGLWSPMAIVDGSAFGAPSLSADFKSPLASTLPFRDLMFENDKMYAVYAGMDDGTLATATSPRPSPFTTAASIRHGCGR